MPNKSFKFHDDDDDDDDDDEVRRGVPGVDV
jgi:hypothetical protein